MSELPDPSDDTIVLMEGVGKAFRRFERQPFLLRTLAGWITRRGSRPHELWPLRGVDLRIRRGEAIGIIGPNGSGKSTLLRLIAGASYPAEGRISVRGRVAPLLALGAGFQPDMTGQECMEINGTALGLTPDEIRARTADIVAFAELADFMQTPVRYYSSGMMARLGFSIAVHTRPDLLLVDEVLAVGDHAFQEKCMARIRRLRDEDTTLLFVSHDANLVGKLCERVLWLRDGRLARDGSAEAVLREYLAAEEAASATATAAPPAPPVTGAA